MRTPVAKTIADIIETVMRPSPIQHHVGAMEEYGSNVTGRTTAPDQFARQVFEAANLLVDGGIELTDSRFIAIEVKYRMNWLKACQAGWRFGELLRRPEVANFRGATHSDST
jgi:hypothetical protein